MTTSDLVDARLAAIAREFDLADLRSRRMRALMLASRAAPTDWRLDFAVLLGATAVLVALGA